jgi:hypothetical protein
MRTVPPTEGSACCLLALQHEIDKRGERDGMVNASIFNTTSSNLIEKWKLAHATCSMQTYFCSLMFNVE